MTGFGKASCRLEERTIVVELRTLNSKTLDISFRLPNAFKACENELRNLLGQHLVRGKIDLSVGFENGSNTPSLTLNKPLLLKYHEELTELAAELGYGPSPDLFAALLKLPDVFGQQSQEPGESELEQLMDTVKEAIQQTNAFRESEGNHLQMDINGRISVIRSLLKDISPLEEFRKEALNARIAKGLGDIRSSNMPDPNRFEQEMIYYLEKLDISEEKVRLEKHLDYFLETLGEPESSGKKLGFISQEMGREINTIGSKANDAAIQKIVVQMKDELEKIKEQLMNIL